MPKEKFWSRMILRAIIQYHYIGIWNTTPPQLIYHAVNTVRTWHWLFSSLVPEESSHIVHVNHRDILHGYPFSNRIMRVMPVTSSSLFQTKAHCCPLLADWNFSVLHRWLDRYWLPIRYFPENVRRWSAQALRISPRYWKRHPARQSLLQCWGNATTYDFVEFILQPPVNRSRETIHARNSGTSQDCIASSGYSTLRHFESHFTTSNSSRAFRN